MLPPAKKPALTTRFVSPPSESIALSTTSTPSPTTAPRWFARLIDTKLRPVVGVGDQSANDQRAADGAPPGPAVEVALCGLRGGAAVNEQQPQRHSPTPGHDR